MTKQRKESLVVPFTFAALGGMATGMLGLGTYVVAVTTGDYSTLAINQTADIALPVFGFITGATGLLTAFAAKVGFDRRRQNKALDTAEAHSKESPAPK